jgi:low affinity Fe/Cu permease
MSEFFRLAAKKIACAIGSPYAFVIAFSGVLLWATLGPVFGFSDTWQLVINTSTTIITFLVVFMIQNTQNRDSKALHLKLDELIRAIGSARNGLIDSEDLPDVELDRLETEFAKLRTDEEKRPASPVRVDHRDR